MAGSKYLKTLLPVRKSAFPADLAVVVIITVLTIVAISAPILSESVFRVVLSLLFVLYIPGYAFIAMLFPESYRSTDTKRGETGTEGAGGVLLARLPDTDGIDLVERAALSFGTSIAIVPLVGIALSFTPWGIHLFPIIAALAGVTIACVVIAVIRRLKIPASRRFSVPFREWIRTLRSRIVTPENRLDSVLTIVLAVSILFALGSISYAVSSPPDGEQFTDFYLLTETDRGELVADNYPETLVAGEPEPMVVGLENHENAQTEYTIIVEIHETTAPDETNPEIVDRQRVTTLEPTVDAGEKWRTEHDLIATMTGEDLRVTYLLYVGEPPSQPTPDNADQSLHLWVNIN